VLKNQCAYFLGLHTQALRPGGGWRFC